MISRCNTTILILSFVAVTKSSFVSMYPLRINKFMRKRRRSFKFTMMEEELNAKNRINLKDPLYEKRLKRWIVMVDDETDILNSVSEYLIDKGYQVTPCVDAETALNICKTEKDGIYPDVIISDIVMPKLNGLDFLRLLRLENSDLASIPVILLTAKGMSEDRVKGYKAGADAYLPKPFDPEELIVIIDNLISRYETLNGKDISIKDLKQDLSEIKHLLLEEGGAGVGKGWVKATNVFLIPDEKLVLEFLCKGLTNREIAKAINLSQRRVEQHITSMFRKTGLGNRTELVRWAISTGNVEM